MSGEGSERPPRPEPGEVTKVRIPGLLPTLNELVDLGKGHWSQYAQVKREYERKIRAIVRRPDVCHRCFYVHYTFYRPDRRTDPSNVAAGGEKLVLDALEDADLIAGDGHRNHRGSEYDVLCDDDVDPQTIVRIRECEYEGL